MSDTTHEVWCLAEGDDVPFPVVSSPTTSIGVLKQKIKAETSFPREVLAKHLTLWKPREIIPVGPVGTLAQRVKALGPDLSQFATVLDPVDTAAGAFQTPTPFSPFLAVIVQIPASAPQGDETSGALESPSKRLRLADDPDTWLEVRSVTPTVLEKLQQFWKSLWHDKKNIFRHCSVPRDINYVQGIDVPATMEVLDLPRTFASIGNVMVRDDYAEAMRAIEGYCTRNTKSVVIVGHPGIGKTILLYYILVKRLLEEKPTILQNNANHLFFFNAQGVKAVSPSNFADPESSEYQNIWALVDINPRVREPADMVADENSPFFLVMASSPRPSRLRGLQKHGRPGAYWLMKPFSLTELIQARQLQPVIHKESDIQNFFEKYGPSARDCYNFCKDDDLERYASDVRSKVQEMSWDFITVVLTSHSADIKAEEGSHRVLLVEPQSEDRTVPRTSIVSKTVSQLLWERDSVGQWRNHHKLFKTLVRIPRAKAFFGTIFEPPFHELCVRGATFTIHPMARRTGQVNYVFRNDQENDQRRNPKFKTSSKTVKLRAQTRFFFDDENNRITNLLADHYYQPIAGNYSSYDSFIYDLNSHQISAFQITTEEEHDLKPKGIVALRELGQRLQIHDLKIRIIVVIFGGAKVTFKVPTSLIQSVSEVYALEVTEKQLYPYS